MSTKSFKEEKDPSAEEQKKDVEGAEAETADCRCEALDRSHEASQRRAEFRARQGTTGRHILALCSQDQVIQCVQGQDRRMGRYPHMCRYTRVRLPVNAVVSYTWSVEVQV
eukprot:9952647-Lingulodinium_polyedra.AAC.1